MASLLDRLFRRAKRGSGSIAKDRLRFVLQHDRINLPPERMEEMKRDILAVIVKYLVIDRDRVEIALEQRDHNHSKLIAEIPFIKEYSPPDDNDPEAKSDESDKDQAKSDKPDQDQAKPDKSDKDDKGGD